MASEVQVMKKETIDIVEARIREFQNNGELHFPENYSPQNALKSAWLILQETKDKDGKAALEVCSKESIANSLLDMVIQGLNPAKKQCYFIPFGKRLTLLRSYHGSIAVTKRIKGVEDIYYDVVYENDVLEFKKERGQTRISKHETKLENIDPQKIKAAYCVIVHDGGQEFTEIMTMAQIRQAWQKSLTKGNGTTHKEFPEEMAKRTVVNRACKRFINSSDDSDLLIHSFNKTNEKDKEIEQEIEENANSEVIDIKADSYIVQDDEKPSQAEKVTPEPQQEAVKEGPDF